MYIQKFLPRVNRDLGVAFLGGKYLATYARQKSGENLEHHHSIGRQIRPP